jgi:hypothetical protein
MKKLSNTESIQKASLVHNNFYCYDKSIYINSRKLVTITCPIHGDFEQKANNHLNGAGCSSCKQEKIANSRRLSFDDVIIRSSKIHNNFYDYSLVKYKNNRLPVTIICPDHGKFKQNIESHLKGSGCPKCANLLSGWQDSTWEKAGNNSHYFEAFQLYIVKCWNDKEQFYKIGKTFNNVEKRYKGKTLPYNYEIVFIKKDSAKNISILERKLINQNKQYMYKPKIFFHGHTECFKKIKNGKLYYN